MVRKYVPGGMMLIPVTDFEEELRLSFLAAGMIAIDPQSGDSLKRIASPENGESVKYVHSKLGKMALLFWAANDEEAIDKANHSME
jgi:hypothetical protein